MVYLVLFVLLNVYYVATIENHVATHWTVSETGVIIEKKESLYLSETPFDLITLMNQYSRFETIERLYNDLSKRKNVLSELWEDLNKGTDMEAFLKEDMNCKKAGVIQAINWRISSLDDGRNKGIPRNEYKLDQRIEDGQQKSFPDCTNQLGPTLTMFDNVGGMKDKDKLKYTPETELPPIVANTMSLEQFGYWTNDMLKLDKTSWLHWLLGSLFWRIKGNAAMALDCCRLAVYYAPKKYKDLGLVSLATIFLRSNYAEDAVLVFRSALDYDNKQAFTHFLLGNSLALVGDFPKAVECYDRSLSLKPKFDLAIRHKHGALCHAAIVDKLPELKKSLHMLRQEIVEFESREDHLLSTQMTFLNTTHRLIKEKYKVNVTANSRRNIKRTVQTMTKLTGMDLYGIKRYGDNVSMIHNFFKGHTTINKWHLKRGVFSYEYVQKFHTELKDLIKLLPLSESRTMGNYDELNGIEFEDGVILRDIQQTPDDKIHLHLEMPAIPRSTSDKDKINNDGDNTKTDSNDNQENYPGLQLGVVKYPPNMKVLRTVHDFDTDSDYPSSSLCNTPAPIGNIEAVFPLFMPFENKGLHIKGLLTEKIGVPASVEHELPWHPPTCGSDKDIVTIKKTKLPYEVENTDYLKNKLLEYVGDGDIDAVRNIQEAEIGHRIYAAMQKKLAPKWLLQTLASLYWRVRDNKQNALLCLLTANKLVKPKNKDLVLLSIASIYLEIGLVDMAVEIIEEAYTINAYEPATNFIISLFNMVRKQRNIHLYYLKQTVRVEPSFMAGLARRLFDAWACSLRRGGALRDLGEFKEGDVCTQVEPGKSMVCEKDGTNCHISNIECFVSKESESSNVVELLQNKIDETSQVLEYIDHMVFNPFIMNMPTNRNDRAAHYANYQSMMRIVSNSLYGCGSIGCSNIKAYELGLNEEECSYQHHLIHYWVHVVGFRQLLNEYELRLPPEMKNMTPSHKKIPECRVFGDPTQDFFLERLSRVDETGWVLSSTMRDQFMAMAQFMDFEALGAKYAKYMETNPRSWLGALGAAWWCGVSGRGACSLRCFTTAFALAPADLPAVPLRALAAMLHLQYKHQDAKDVAFLTFYISPKSKIEAFLAAVSHSFVGEYDQAVWMFRYTLVMDPDYLPSKAALHATMCLMLFGPYQDGYVT